MESRYIVILFSLLLIAEIPIKGHSVQSSAPGYFGSPTRSTSENLGIKRYVSAGDRAYEVGTLDGAFPQIGWHVKGHMNGVWAPLLSCSIPTNFWSTANLFPTRSSLPQAPVTLSLGIRRPMACRSRDESYAAGGI